MSKCIAIYSRKSKFTGKGESVENQHELCRQYIEKHYAEDGFVEIVTYEDEGFSGKNTARPQFRRMLSDARKKKFAVLVCYRLDRISRNVGDFASLIEELGRLGIDFISIREAFDTSNPMGRAMMYIASVFAQLERETIAERIRDNMYELAKTGRWLGGTTPLGYCSESMDKVTVDGKVKKAYKLKLIPEEAQLVQRIYDKYLETGSLTKTDAYLVQNNYVTRNRISFNRFSIRSILTNPVYMVADEDAYRYITDHRMDLFSEVSAFDNQHGIMAYNRTLQTEGRANQLRSMEEWIITVGRHEGIVSGRRWVRVQDLLAQNKSMNYKKPRSNQAVLAGLVICNECGSYMRPKLTRRYTPEGDRSYDYICTLKERSNGVCCNMKHLQGNLADQIVLTRISKLDRDYTTFVKQMKVLYKELTGQLKEQGSDLERIRKLITENEKEIAALVTALARSAGSTAEHYILEQIEEHHNKTQDLREQVKQLQATLVQDMTEEEIQSASRQALDYNYCLHQASVEQQRNAIRTIIKKVLWDGEKLKLYLNAAEPLGEDSK